MVFLTRFVGVDSFSITECQAAFSLMMNVNIHVYVYESVSEDSFKRIACFDDPHAVANLANSV